MKRFLFLLISAVFVLVGVIVALPFFIPVDHYKQPMTEWISQATGRQVSIEGDLQLTLLPSISLQVDKVRIANPTKDFASPYFANIERLNLQLQLWPLLQRKAVIDALQLDNPEIYLERTRSGKTNWQLNTPDNVGKLKASPDAAEQEPADFSFNVNKVIIQNAKLQWNDAGDLTEFNKLQANFTEAGAEITTTILHEGLSVAMLLASDQPMAALQGRAMPLRVKLKQDSSEFSFEGHLDGVDLSQNQFADWRVSGHMQASVESLAALQQAITGTAGKLEKSLSVQSPTVNLTAGKLSLEDIDLQLGEMSALGNLQLVWSNKKPFIKGGWRFSELDLDDWITNPETVEDSVTVADADGKQPVIAAGWDKSPIDFSDLDELDGDLKLSIGDLRAAGFLLSGVDATLSLRDGTLSFTMPEAMLGTGKIRVDGNLVAGAFGSRWQEKLVLSAVPAELLQQPFMRKPRLTGSTSGELFLESQGKSVDEWMHQLRGNGQLTVQDGSIRGYSLPALFRNVSEAFKPADQRADADETKTDFSMLKIGYQAEKGVVNLVDAEIKAPLLRATAEGSIAMGERQVDVTMRPKLVPNLKGQSADADEMPSGIMVPVHAHGPFEDIQFSPDMKGAVDDLLANPDNLDNTIDAVVEQGKQINENFKQQKETVKKSLRLLKENKDPDVPQNTLDSAP